MACSVYGLFCGGWPDYLILYGHQQGRHSSPFEGTSGAANRRPPEHGTQELYQQDAIDSKKKKKKR
jgi:hypothetical protein